MSSGGITSKPLAYGSSCLLFSVLSAWPRRSNCCLMRGVSRYDWRFMSRGPLHILDHGEPAPLKVIDALHGIRSKGMAAVAFLRFGLPGRLLLGTRSANPNRSMERISWQRKPGHSPAASSGVSTAATPQCSWARARLRGRTSVRIHRSRQLVLHRSVEGLPGRWRSTRLAQPSQYHPTTPNAVSFLAWPVPLARTLASLCVPCLRTGCLSRCVFGSRTTACRLPSLGLWMLATRELMGLYGFLVAARSWPLSVATGSLPFGTLGWATQACGAGATRWPALPCTALLSARTNLALQQVKHVRAVLVL